MSKMSQDGTYADHYVIKPLADTLNAKIIIMSCLDDMVEQIHIGTDDAHVWLYIAHIPAINHYTSLEFVIKYVAI